MKLGIYGTGGLGREVLMLAQQINASDKRWSGFFFIDDINPNRILKGVAVYPFAEVESSAEVEIIIAVGEPTLRTVLMSKVKTCEIALATLISSAAYIAPCSRIGAGVAIFQGANVSCDCIIENNVIMQAFSSLSHDCHVAEHCVISTYSVLAGGVSVGAGTFIGMGAQIREMTCVGSGTIVGMGANVVADVPDHVIVMGNPARKMKENCNHQVFKKINNAKA